MNLVKQRKSSKSIQKGALVVLLILSVISSLFFVNHNASFYDETIAEVTQTKLLQKEQVTDEFQNRDTIYHQELTAKILNGNEKGRIIQLQHTYTASGGFDDAYHEGNKLFVKKNAENQFDITGMKRDHLLLGVVWILILILIFIGRKQGVLSLLSLVINMGIIAWIIQSYTNWDDYLIPLCMLGCVLFTVISLTLVNGWNEKTFTAILATLVGTFISFGIAVFVLWLTKENGMRYEELQFITRPYKTLFFAGLLVASLGAVMDIAITMSSSLFGLYEKNPHISIKQLAKSGREIGKDIMGPMTNILFFVYVSGSIPMMVLFFKNHATFTYTLSTNLTLEIVRALVGGIGIVLTIPISLFIVLFFIKRKQVKQ